MDGTSNQLAGLQPQSTAERNLADTLVRRKVGAGGLHGWPNRQHGGRCVVLRVIRYAVPLTFWNVHGNVFGKSVCKRREGKKEREKEAGSSK